MHGHDGEEPGDRVRPEDKDGNCEGTTTSSKYISTVEEITPQQAIEMEKCIVFTDTLMLLITTLHGIECL